MLDSLSGLVFSSSSSSTVWHCGYDGGRQSTPTRGCSPFGRICSRGGLAWMSISSSIKPSAGGTVVVSSGGELEDDGSLELSLVVVVFVSVAWVLSMEGGSVPQCSDIPSDPVSSFSCSLSPTSSLASSSSSSLAVAPALLPQSLSFSEGGQVEVGVAVSPSSLTASSLLLLLLCAPLVFRCTLWWRTRLCFSVNVRSHVWHWYGRSPANRGRQMSRIYNASVRLFWSLLSGFFGAN